MLRLENVDKYFFRHKSNEIHVINNTSLDFEEKGMVALLGPSGCGKTTLLNVIGGLDKVNSGNVYVNGQKITGRRAGKVDQIRNLNIGYIFQSYNLIDNMTVFDNVAMVLKMVGIKDKEEIREKVDYALELVGMYRYRRRFADMLSGGERQRVGIARAIVKDPSIIIADEPTGNLDSANTLEVMNIIKTISKEKLVVLVTHEETLANFYADRIIRLMDGKVISDNINDNAQALDYRIENKIYLKDLPNHRRFVDGKDELHLYDDGSSPMNLDIVIQNGNLFIRNRDELGRTEVIDHNSAVELVNDHYRAVTKEESQQHELDREKLKPRRPLKHSSILGPISTIRQGFKSVGNYHVLKKILLVGFLLSAVFITYSVSNIYGMLDLQDKAFVTDDKDYIRVMDKNVKVDDFLAYEKDPNVNYALPGDARVNFNFAYDKYIQTSYGSAQLSGSLSSKEKLTESDIVEGRLPEKRYEIVVDELCIDNLNQWGDASSAGYANGKEVLGKKVTIPNMKTFTIVGITDKQSPVIYVSPKDFINILANTQSQEEYYGYDEGMQGGEEQGSTLMDYKLKEKDIEIASGRLPEAPYEVIVSYDHIYDMYINQLISPKVNGQKLTVVGFYKGVKDDIYFVTNDTIKYKLILESANVTIDPVDKKACQESLEATGAKVRDLYKYNRNQYRKEMFGTIKATLIVAGLVVLISLVEIYLIMRASFLSRIKEVGILRAIGVKKSDIYRMFLGEILAITLIASVPGFLGMSYLVTKLQGISYMEDMFLYDTKTALTALILIFGFNIVFGLLPVMRTMVKKPAAILARTDVN